MAESSVKKFEWDSFHTSFVRHPNGVSGEICRNSKVSPGEWKCMPPLPPNASEEVPEFADEMGSSVIPCMLEDTLQTNGAIRFSSNFVLRDAFEGNSNYLVSLEQLIPRVGLKKALLTSFIPCSWAFFMNHFDKDVELTAVLPPHMASTMKLDAESKGLLCRNPFHDEIFCDLCEEDMIVGEIYSHCFSCGVDLCGKCKEEMNVRSFSKEGLHHEPHNCYCEQIIHTTSKECNCEDKRSIEVVVAPFENDTYSIQHGKLMVLDYVSHLRIIISSFNLDDDKQWEVFSDSFWWQDFPKTKLRGDHMRSEFFVQLHVYIGALGCSEWADYLANLGLNISLLDPNLHLITSIPVPFRPKDSADLVSSSGICSVDKVLKTETPELDSSSPVFVSVFSFGAAGLWWQEPMADALGARLDDGSLRLVIHGSTMIFQPNMDLRAKGSLWHVADNEDGRHWHSKMTFRTWKPVGCRCDKLHGWVMVGSHNWSKASWGTSKKLGDPKRGENHLWELGILWLSPSCGDGVLDMRTVPAPFTPSKVRPFSFKDSYTLSSFSSKETNPSIVRAVCMVIAYGRKGITVVLPHSEPPVREATLDLDIWRSTRLPYPPEFGTILSVRLLIQGDIKDSKVIWVERIFEPQPGSSPAEDDDKEEWAVVGNKGRRRNRKM